MSPAWTAMAAGKFERAGLPERETVTVRNRSGDESTNVASDVFEWKDSKRILLAMLAHNGMGGDGTVTYYIMQEGEVKPRQNG